MGRLSTHVSRVTHSATSDEETDLDGRCRGYVFRSRAACAARVAQQNNDMGSCTGQGSRMSQCFPSFWGSVLCRNPRYRVLRIAMISQGMTCSPHIAVNPCPLVLGIHAILIHVHVFDSHQSRVPPRCLLRLRQPFCTGTRISTRFNGRLEPGEMLGLSIAEASASTELLSFAGTKILKAPYQVFSYPAL